MKRVDRLVLGEVLGPLVVAAGTFVVLLVGHFLFGIIRTVVEHGVPLWAVLRFLWYQLPNALALGLPVAMLLASALAAHRLARDNELTAMRAAGLSRRRILAPVWGVGLAVSITSFAIAEYVQPIADRRAEGIKLDVWMERKTLALQEGKFSPLASKLWVLPGEIDDDTGEVSDLKLFLVEPKGETEGSITLVESSRGHVVGDDFLLDRPVFTHMDAHGGLTRSRSSLVATVHLPEAGKQFTAELRRKENLSIGDILEQLRTRDSLPKGTLDPLIYQLHHRIALAMACLAFALIGGPMALVFRDGRSIGGVLAAVLFGFVYFFGMLMAQNAGVSGQLPPVVAAWLPTGATAAVALLLLWRRC